MTVLVGARDAERGRAAERELRDGGTDARFVPIDVTDAESVTAAAKQVQAEHGRLDVLVNNAGIILADGALGLPDGRLRWVRRAALVTVSA
ncbi:SDR family NAD(P)-dependent oxidoreductase [Micromonospora zamorensis]|uniref:SDR family NAD(P)-dependent oxidoreductase n=1 Tax=Micromonospora zamorensis TaxID=709883 RepID=UPI0036B6DB79